MIQINNLSFNIDEKEILKDINLNISEGKIFGIIGPNGVGKSTLLRCLSGIYKPTVGEVSYENENVYDNAIIIENIIAKNLFLFEKVLYTTANAAMVKAIAAIVIKCTGSVSGNPLVSAVKKWPNAPAIAPYTGPNIIAAKKAGIESKAIDPMTLILAPIKQSATNSAVNTNFFVFIIIPPLL